MRRNVPMSICVGVCFSLLVCSSSYAAVAIETVAVGDVGNQHSGLSYYPAGYGSVNYEYNIGKYEVTAGQYTEFLNAVAATDTYGLYNDYMKNGRGCRIQRSGEDGGYSYTVASDYADRPVNFVSWGDAARLANWLHNGQPAGMQTLSTTEDGAYYLNGAVDDESLSAVTRKSDWLWAIPTEDEWYKAAYYNGDTGYYNKYPWVYPDGIYEAYLGRDMDDAEGWNANLPGNPSPIDAPYHTTVIGEFQNTHSYYGTFDQCGNIAEWTEGVDDRGDRAVWGGSFYFAGTLIYGHSSAEHFMTGIRLVAVPEPGSLLLLAAGALTALRRRR